MFATELKHKTMHEQISNDLIEVANKFPDLTVSISIKDLMAANRSLINETKEELTRTITESKREMYLPREKVLEMLGISPTTLWRWQQCGYLVPISVGGRNRFKLSDINKILGV